jgi:CHAD domain-containing protein
VTATPSAADRLGTLVASAPTLDEHSSTRIVVQLAFAKQARRLATVADRLSDGDPSSETVHDARLALRAARSHLRMFASILDVSRRDALATTLTRLANALGPRRDLDVMIEGIERYEVALANDGDALSALLEQLGARRSSVDAELRSMLSDATPATALDALVDFALDLPIVDRADDAAAVVLTDLARRPWRKLARVAALLDETSASADLHELRICTKRARHAALAARAVRPAATAHVAALGHLARTLGELNDATITTERLRAAIAFDFDALAAYGAGLVVAAERQRMAAARAAWPGQWQQARRKRVRAWLDSSD